MKPEGPASSEDSEWKDIVSLLLAERLAPLRADEDSAVASATGFAVLSSWGTAVLRSGERARRSKALAVRVSFRPVKERRWPRLTVCPRGQRSHPATKGREAFEYG
ncbi:hypothetical protein BV898_12118 [Hypsibius exemplaris]|uniref:Uncharacterized protein n=1 Tax=Hypsibius exemplaris TaxID=2072580 RepID=A0A1W0WEP4_HYPEX|nr:hypothetical protein BV898_12118 [Hypsibius exemplaris]